jgi:hypothetical protein
LPFILRNGRSAAVPESITEPPPVNKNSLRKCQLSCQDAAIASWTNTAAPAPS